MREGGSEAEEDESDAEGRFRYVRRGMQSGR